jgi:threonylcarbamoyladenosine tRNA methylthiotransferase MtaB
MHRRYDAARVASAVAHLRSVKDDPFLACDIIAGFPGETEAEFEESYARIEQVDFAWIHAFPFSPRPGTEAAGLPGHISEHYVRERVERLLELGRRGHEAYLSRWIGREVFAVAEVPSATRNRGLAAALSENYLKLAIPIEPSSPSPRPGTTLRCRIIAASRPASPPVEADEAGIEDARAELVETVFL